MNVIKRKNEFGYSGYDDIYIQKDNQTLEILFAGNGDLYWILDNNIIDPKTYQEHKKHLESPYQEKFIITKENYFIYQLFDELINDIEQSRIFIPTENKLEQEFDLLGEEEKENQEERCNRVNKEHKQYFRYKLLYQDGVVSWHSDEHIYEDADRVKIYRLNDEIILDFSRPPVKKEEHIYRMPGRTGIRFRNSGSTYEPYNVIFMRMFQKLQEYDPNYHQIHIEELEYQKRLVRKK